MEQTIKSQVPGIFYRRPTPTPIRTSTKATRFSPATSWA